MRLPPCGPLLCQANGSLPAACDCAYGPISLGLPRFTHGVVRHDAASLSPETLALIDAHSQVRDVVHRSHLPCSLHLR